MLLAFDRIPGKVDFDGFFILIIRFYPHKQERWQLKNCQETIGRIYILKVIVFICLSVIKAMALRHKDYKQVFQGSLQDIIGYHDIRGELLVISLNSLFYQIMNSFFINWIRKNENGHYLSRCMQIYVYLGR